jgi:transcriptional regulator with XRE-family HTH domain
VSYGPTPTSRVVVVPIDFGARVRRLRQTRGLTATLLGAAVGVTEQAVNSWEQGRRRPTDLAVVVRVAAALGVTLDELTGDPVEVAP